LATAAAGFPGLARAAEDPAVASAARPRHVIHLVVDGMSSGTLTAADYFSRLARQQGLRWFDLARSPDTVSAFVNMRSLNSVVTDSSAASSSWGSGSRVVNGVLNQLPDGRDLRPLFSLLDEARWERGLVTTTEITHATPAGFVANCSSRGDADPIAAQYLARHVEVLLGGGRKFFDPKQRKDKRDLPGAFRAAGYAVMNQAAELAAAPLGPRWLGTFANGHLPFSVDRQASSTLSRSVPVLAEMTRRALAKLARADRFILQVEGGRVDHAAHNCDIVAAARDLVAFDEALEVCLEFQRRERDTLVVVTTDHGTANPGLNGTGTAYKETPALFAHTLRVTRSFEHLEADLKKASTVAELSRLLREATGYKVPEAKAAQFLAWADKRTAPLYDGMDSLSAQLGQLLANYLGVGWTGSAHTADFVPLLARGPGATRFHGYLQNTDVFRHYLALADIDFRNPEVPLLAESRPGAAEVEALA